MHIIMIQTGIIILFYTLNINLNVIVLSHNKLLQILPMHMYYILFSFETNH